ncbi:MAG: response regulator transcription factor [Anaerolineaceae bacterium]|nr:MAG: response regulator transcription factor [Anaerolineaceae bacterium]
MDTIKVVSIDDHPLIHEAIRSLLSRYEHIDHVGEGYVGDHVLPLVEKHDPDVIILDLIMPQSDVREGSFTPLQLLSELRQQFQEVSVIILSQYLHRGIAQVAIEHGVKGYLLKSDNLSLNLPIAIEHIYKGGVYFSTAFSQEMFSRRDPQQANLLTERQKEVILAVAKAPDLSYAQIAANLHLETRTVKGHLSNAYKVLGVTNITACIIRCMQIGIISLEVTETGLQMRSY